jgi:hypothetical protein
LFAAIEEGRFERVGDLAAKYKHSVVRYLADAEIQETIAPLSDILKPLYAARDLLRIIREHQSAQFQKLAMGSLYRFPAPSAKGKTFDVNA